MSTTEKAEMPPWLMLSGLWEREAEREGAAEFAREMVSVGDGERDMSPRRCITGALVTGSTLCDTWPIGSRK